MNPIEKLFTPEKLLEEFTDIRDDMEEVQGILHLALWETDRDDWLHTECGVQVLHGIETLVQRIVTSMTYLCESAEHAKMAS